jgi:hypothetical protein
VVFGGFAPGAGADVSSSRYDDARGSYGVSPVVSAGVKRT